MPDPANPDSLAPNGPPRRFDRGMWTRPGSAQPGNPDTTRWAPPTAATVRESLACKAALARRRWRSRRPSRRALRRGFRRRLRVQALGPMGKTNPNVKRRNKICMLRSELENPLPRSKLFMFLPPSAFTTACGRHKITEPFAAVISSACRPIAGAHICGSQTEPARDSSTLLKLPAKSFVIQVPWNIL